MNRRATARAELVMVGVVTGSVGLGVTAFTLGPAVINASNDLEEGQLVMPSDPAQASACAALHELFSASREILGVWHTNNGAFTEVLLWWSDTHDADRVNRDEVVLLTHSPALGTISAYACEGFEGFDAASMGLLVTNQDESADAADCSTPLRRSRLNDRFPWRWRSTPGVNRTIVATGLSSFTITPVREPADAHGWRVRVEWGPEISDTEDEACSFVVHAEP